MEFQTLIIWVFQVQQEILLKRQKDKKEMLEAVKKYRKGNIRYNIGFISFVRNTL